MTQTPFNLDLDEYLDGDETCLVSRKNGEVVLARMKGAGIDWMAMEADGTIIVTIPNRIITMNRSFFEAVWGDRIVALRVYDFTNKYTFVASDHITRKVFDAAHEIVIDNIIRKYYRNQQS